MQQHFRMRTHHPQFRASLARLGQVAWVGSLQPTPLSEAYLVRIFYRLGYRPKISVLSPKLQLPAGAIKLPHTYSKNELCLYYPPNKEWDATRYIADYIVPWVALWLLYYEGWLATGVWHGGGIEHGLSLAN